MTIEELEAILRADAQGSERADSEVGDILEVMSVLAQKRRESNPGLKTAEQAWHEFQYYYLPMVYREQDLDLSQLYDGLYQLRQELEENHHDAEFGCVDYKAVKALAATYELLDYLSGRIATAVATGEMEPPIDY